MQKAVEHKAGDSSRYVTFSNFAKLNKNLTTAQETCHCQNQRKKTLYIVVGSPTSYEINPPPEAAAW